MPAQESPINYGLSYAARVGVVLGGPVSCVIHGASQGLVIQSSAADEVCIGVVNEFSDTAPAADDMVTVFITGIVWCVASAALATLGIPVSTAAAGKVVTAGAGETIVGITMTIADGDGDQVAVLLTLECGI